MLRRLIPVGLVAALLAGCAVGPRYHEPAPPAHAASRFVTASPALSQTQPLPPRWWRLYDDPVLDDLVRQALTENQDLRVAAANLAYAQALTSEAVAGEFPATALSAGGTEQQVRPIGPGASASPFFTYAAGFSANYEVDLFGRVRRAIEAGRANAQAAAAAEDQVRVAVAAGTASAYANVCGLGEQLAVARRSLGIVQEAYNLTKVQRDAGSLSDFDLAREAVLLDQARAAIPPLEGERRAELFTLAALVGRTPAEIPAQAAACVTPPTLRDPLPVGDGAALLRRRPDLREAERNLAAYTARVGVAVASLYPSVTIGGGVNTVATSVSGLGRGNAVAFNVGPLITWSFPNLLVARAQVREAGAQAGAALATLEGDIQKALRDVETALSAYAAELDHNAALRSASANAEQALRLANVQYEAGSSSFLDLLTSQQTAVQAAQALAVSDQAVSADQVAVFQALGGGWEGAPAVPAPVVR